MRTQADIDAFDQGITNISGDLIIGGNDIANLSALSNVTSVGGDLSINNNAILANVDGLSNLTRIGRNISISRNSTLISLEGLSNVFRVGGDLDISDNASLINIDGLSNIERVVGRINILGNTSLRNVDGLTRIRSLEDLRIESNAVLENVDGFSNLISVQGITISRNDLLNNLDGLSNLRLAEGLGVTYNASLTNINGLSNLEALGGGFRIDDNALLNNINGLSNIRMIDGQVEINRNPSLINIDGLANLTKVGRQIGISSNNALMNVDGLSNLDSLGSSLSIEYNEVLMNLEGLSRLDTIGGRLSIRNNNALLNLNGLSNINSIGWDLWVEDNLLLTNVDDLSNILSIGGSLTVEGNAVLTQIDGLSNVTTVEDLRIVRNGSLANLDGLSNLTSVGGNLYIIRNTSLTNIDGLSNVVFVERDLDIRFNDVLMDCCGIQPLLNTPGAIYGSMTINSNPSECSSPQEVLTSCFLNFSVIASEPCLNLDNGSLCVDVNGYDSVPFIYNWTRLEDGMIGSGVSYDDLICINNLSDGTYDIIVTTPLPDTAILSGFILDNILGSIFQYTEITTNNGINGLPNGTLDIFWSASQGPYSISWSGPVSGSMAGITDLNYTIPNLSTGVYQVDVRDANNQLITIEITLPDDDITTLGCEEPLDIIVLNLVSSAIDAEEYGNSKPYFQSFIENLNLGTGNEDSQVAIAEWSGRDEQDLRVPLTGNISDLSAYSDMSRSYTGSTDILYALRFGYEYLRDNGRADAEKVIIFTYDGCPGFSGAQYAQELKESGIVIADLGIDYVSRSSTYQRILREAASNDDLAHFAADFNLLDPLDLYIDLTFANCSGTSSSVYFDRDGSITIVDIGSPDCNNLGFVELTFTVTAHDQLAIPAGMHVAFYHNDPTQYGASFISDFLIPCSIPVGESETFTVTLPITTATHLYAVLNDDGMTAPSFELPVTDISESLYANNIDNIRICTDATATLQALKASVSLYPICEDIVQYTVNVCNIGTLDASDVTVTDVFPDGCILTETIVNTNSCATDLGTSYDIPAGCCLSLMLSYDVAGASEGYYGDQDVILSGPAGQTYLDFDGATTTAEDILLDGTEDCGTPVVTFTKKVNHSTICVDHILTYTFTIDNQSSNPLYGVQFSDILPAPLEWVYKPYNEEGLTINVMDFLEGQTASFVIDQIDAETEATFVIDVNVGYTDLEVIANNTARIDGFPDYINGGVDFLESNTTTTTILGDIEIIALDTIIVGIGEGVINLTTMVNPVSDIEWTTSGDGVFSNTSTMDPTYTLGQEDQLDTLIALFISVETPCGRKGKSVFIKRECDQLILPDTILVTMVGASITLDAGILTADSIRWTTSGDGSYTSPTTSSTDYIFGSGDIIVGEVSLFVSVYSLCGESEHQVLVILDMPECMLQIDQLDVGICNDNGTESDPSDDTYEVTLNITAINPGVSNTYAINDGINNYGSFNYGSDQVVTLPADGVLYTLAMTDSDDAMCSIETTISQSSCSSACLLSIDLANVGVCNDNGTESDPSDDTYEVTLNISAINPGVSNTYTINDGINNYGPFNYGSDQVVTLPADGILYTLTMTDSDDAMCSIETTISQSSCSSACLLSIDLANVGVCNDNGTESDPSDDTYEVTLNISAINPGVSNTYTINDGLNNYGPFNYGSDQVVTLPADGVLYTLAMTDSDDAMCSIETQVSQNSCSSLCGISIDLLNIGACNDGGTMSDSSDDTYLLTINVSAVNPDVNINYFINDGTNNYGSFNYGEEQEVILPADGQIYTLTIIDSDDPTCTLQTQVSQDPCSSGCQLSIDIQDVGPCNDNGTESDPSDDTYNVTINISTINPGASNSYVINDGTNNYGPFNYGSDQIITLPADGQMYNLICTDIDDVACRTSLEVSQSNCVCNIDFVYDVIHPLCKEDLFGQVNIELIIGSDISYDYSFDGFSFTSLDLASDNNSAIINELIPGDYKIIIRESADTSCQQILAFTINEPFVFNIDLGADTTIRLGESIDVNPSADIDITDLAWSWLALTSSTDLTCDDCPNPSITPSQSTTYQATATHINGCIATDQIAITVTDDYEIFIPNAFTPNGDNFNDAFAIYPGLGVASISTLKIFGRWGEMLYDQSPYLSADNFGQDLGWDGTFLGEEMNAGVYIYFIEIELDNGRQVVLSGDVTLVR